MTQHNISGNEAHLPGAHVQVRLGRRRRRLHPAVWMHLAMIPAGLVAGATDVRLGMPVAISLCGLVFLLLILLPGRR